MPTIAEQNPLTFLMELAAREGDVATYATSYGPIWSFHHPHHIQQILQSPNFHRSALVRVLLGDGLLSSDGEYWRQQRRLIQPRFQPQQIHSFASVMNASVSATLDRWERGAELEESFDLSVEMTRLTLEIVVQALFNTDVSQEGEFLSDAITTIMEDLGSIAGTMFNVPVSFDPGRNARVAEALETIDQFVYRMIDERLDAAHQPDDLLSYLLAAQRRDGTSLNRRQLRDEVVTMLVSGHETTALILSWAWYLVAQDVDVERRLTSEVDRVLEGRFPAVDDLPRLPYCRMVLDETMRLYPPVWFIVRQTLADDELAGFRIPARSTIVISPYVVHRHPTFWEDAERFDPERFQPAVCAARPRFAHLPFGGGRHICLGSHFAMMEGIFVLARVLQRYQVRLVPGHPVKPHPVLTLRQRYGLQATVKSRLPATRTCNAICQVHQ